VGQAAERASGTVWPDIQQECRAGAVLLENGGKAGHHLACAAQRGDLDAQGELHKAGDP
jgi:hypothetical protein